jgi:hypothetical protein
MSLTAEEIAARRGRQDAPDRVLFRVSALYGLSRGSVRLPLNRTESIESGQVCVTIDPEADPSGNIGMIDFTRRTLRVRYGCQVIFPGLHDLVMSGKFDPNLLRPPRAVATDDCTVTPDYSGWRALGCIDFLPGSIWAGAGGG